MISNIKIVGNINNVSTIIRYDGDDINLIPSENVQSFFGQEGDYIEYYIYDAGENLLSTNYNYLNYKLPPSSGLNPGLSSSLRDNNSTTSILTESSSLYPIIEIDPINDIQKQGYSSGEFKVIYNIFNRTLSNIQDKALFIKEISQDRTEIRLISTTLTNDEIEKVVSGVIDKINNSSYNIDYLLNFGNNQQFLTTNIALNKVSTSYEILFKLYKPLPPFINEKQTLCIVEEKVNPYVFDINLDKLIQKPEAPKLKGPNFDIKIDNKGTSSTKYTDYNSALISLQALQSSSYNHINNILNDKSIKINVDYTDFSNFIHFSSAYKRVNNFYNKVKQIEDYNNLIRYYTPYITTTSSLQLEINQYSSSINDIITQFDKYENYLYFESSSYTWPKSGSLKPYVLLSTGSTTTITWYNDLTGSALTYDESNYDNLVYSIPDFIRDDENNAPFLVFLNMIGHHFDNIWVYIKAITDVNLANNNLDKGISKDLVYDKLKSLGIKLYNNQAGEDLDNYLIGANTGSNIWDDDFSLTGSYLNNIPRKDLLAERYKRIYHNLPLLLKTKGTKLGLEYLISTFGIPNKDFYKVGDNTYYTITGSNMTSSILNVKEYGGSTKYNLIRGYNDEKVRIVNNEITGNVLSPLISLQTSPTESNSFIENDSHFIDISFSPEDEINKYISSSINSNNPTWVIDDYIGDPRQTYSSSYNDLFQQRELYYKTGVSGYPGFTGSLLDYNGFIRLIQYFDNALFKMLEDFVPERTSLSTGIVIESPVLERNKVVYPVPKIEKQQIHTAEYSSPTINEVYDKIYYDTQGDKKSYFDGNISGSNIDVHSYFISGNLNPYLRNWDIYNNQNDVSKSINLNKFLHSDYNVLFNNVSQSIDSVVRKKIEYIYGTTGSLTSSVELQDSYLNLSSYNNSRYKGVKLTSLDYNIYTSASYTSSFNTIQNGDLSYGKTAVIDRNSYKLGWVQIIPTQSLNFYNKTTVNLRYLVDTKNELTELNSYNNNLFEVQNIFKSGKPAIISLSNPNQTKKDGKKLVWKGGYSYSPVIYRENGDVLTFVYDNYIATSSLPLGFLATDTNRYEFESYQGYTPASTIKNVGFQNYFYINGIASSTTPLGNTVVATEVIDSSNWNYTTSKLSYSDTTFDYPNRTKTGPIYRFGIFNFNNFNTTQFTTIPTTAPVSSSNGYTYGYFNEPISSSFMNDIYKVTRTGIYKIHGGTTCRIAVVDPNDGWSKFKIALLVEKASETEFNNGIWKYYSSYPIGSIVRVPGGFGGLPVDNNFDPLTNSIKLDVTSYATFNISFRNPIIVTIPANTYLRLSFYFLDKQDLFGNSSAVEIKFSNTFWSVGDANQFTTEYIYKSNYTSSNALFSLNTTYKSNDTLLFTNAISEYFYSSSFSGSSVNYSEVNDNFSIEKGDLIKFGKFKDPSDYYEVLSSEITGSPYKYKIVTTKSILTSSVNMSNNFAVLRPKPDETSVILEGRKVLGEQEIEKALIIPYDASNNLNNNIGNIIKSLNTSI